MQNFLAYYWMKQGDRGSNLCETLTAAWCVDPLTQGCQPCLASSTGASHVQALAEPQGRRLLAGDATNWSRTQVTDGASTSGIREAQRLLRQTSVTLRLHRPLA